MTDQQTQHHCHGGFFATTAAAHNPTTISTAGNKQCHDCGSQSLKRSSAAAAPLQEPTPKKLNLHGFSRLALPLSNPIEPAKHSLHRTLSGPTAVNSPPQPPPISALPFSNPHSPPENVPTVMRRSVSDITSPEFQHALNSDSFTRGLNPIFESSENVCTTSASPSPPTSASRPPIPRRSVSDITSPAFQQALSTITPPLERTVSLTPSCNSDSSTRGRSPSLERVKIMDEMAKEISEWCKETMRQIQQVDDDEEEEEDGSDDNNPQEEEAMEQIEEEEEAEDGDEDNHQPEEEEEKEKEKALTETHEAVSVDRVGDCLTIHFACPCGKGYQILLSGKSCYYKLVPY